MIKYAIGIDPDVNKSGVAVWKKEGKQFTMMATIPFFELIDFLTPNDFLKKGEFVAYIEAAWLHDKNNWHGGKAGIGHNIAKKVGANHQVGKLIEEYCKREGIQYELVKPTRKKLNAKEFKNLTKYEGSTNQETRDAAMLVFGL